MSLHYISFLLLDLLLLASERDTIRSVQFELVRYMYIYIMEVRVPNSSAYHAYVMWVELGTAIFYTC